jgi:hypothetical protein
MVRELHQELFRSEVFSASKTISIPPWIRSVVKTQDYTPKGKGKVIDDKNTLDLHHGLKGNINSTTVRQTYCK